MDMTKSYSGEIDGRKIKINFDGNDCDNYKLVETSMKTLFEESNIELLTRTAKQLDSVTSGKPHNEERVRALRDAITTGIITSLEKIDYDELQVNVSIEFALEEIIIEVFVAD